MVEIDGERYHDASSAADHLHISRFQFYANVRSRIEAYKFGGRKRWLYKEADLAAFRTVEVVRMPVSVGSSLCS